MIVVIIFPASGFASVQGADKNKIPVVAYSSNVPPAGFSPLTATDEELNM